MSLTACTQLTHPVVTVFGHIGAPFWIWYSVSLAKTAEPAKNLIHQGQWPSCSVKVPVAVLSNIQ